MAATVAPPEWVVSAAVCDDAPALVCDPPFALLTELGAARVGALEVTVAVVVPAAFGVGAAGAALTVVGWTPVVAWPPAVPVPLPVAGAVLAGGDETAEPAAGVVEPPAFVVEVAAGAVAPVVGACVPPFALPVALEAVPFGAAAALVCAVVWVVLAPGAVDGAADGAVVGAALAVGALVPGVALVEPEDAPTGGF